MVITITSDKALSSCRHRSLASVPSTAVASRRSDCAGMNVYVRVIWTDKSRETAEQHVYHRAAHGTKGCQEHRRWWEVQLSQGASSYMFLVHLHLQKSSKKLSNRSCITSQVSHPLLLLHLGGALKEACGHVGRYNLTSLALVKSSTFPYCYVYAPDWLLACQTIINWHHTSSHTHTQTRNI